MLKIRFTDQRQDPIWVVEKSFSIGSAEDNDLMIDDTSVSLQHARVLLINGVYTLLDLSSQSGTFVNGQRITQKPVGHGDRFQLGDVSLEIIDPATPGTQADWILVACSSWLAGQEFAIRSRSHSHDVKIGRSSHCDLVFPGTHLSREHALLTLSEEHVRVRDLDSANGTYINEARVSDGVLYSGDQLRLDVYNFRIFGPGKRPLVTPSDDDQATQIRSTPNIKPVATEEPLEEAQPKQWKTRSTSPGNRSEALPQSQAANTMKLLAVLLGLAVVALVIYVLVG